MPDTPDDMVVVAPTEYHQRPWRAAVFLAGGITGCPDWQQVATEQLLCSDEGRYDVAVLNPRRPVFDSTVPGIEQAQIDWEYRHLRLADLVVFWFPDAPSDQPDAMFALAAALGRTTTIIVGADPHWRRYPNLAAQVRCERPDLVIHTSLEDTVAAARERLRQPGPGLAPPNQAYSVIHRVVGRLRQRAYSLPSKQQTPAHVQPTYYEADHQWYTMPAIDGTTGTAVHLEASYRDNGIHLQVTAASDETASSADYVNLAPADALHLADQLQFLTGLYSKLRPTAAATDQTGAPLDRNQYVYELLHASFAESRWPGMPRGRDVVLSHEDAAVIAALLQELAAVWRYDSLGDLAQEMCQFVHQHLETGSDWPMQPEPALPVASRIPELYHGGY